MNKRGQIFLVAAILIVSIVISLATAVNTVKVSGNDEAFYDLAEEVGFETKKVLDYGVFNSNSQEDINSLMDSYLENYKDYLAPEETLFIYGNAQILFAKYFDETEVGDVGIFTGTIPILATIQYTTGQQADVKEFDDDTNGETDRVTVEINGIIYEFNLREGQNFFFVIIKDENDEKFVARGE